MAETVTAGQALLYAAFDNLFAEKMKALEPGSYGSPDEATAAIYSEIFLGMIHRDQTIDQRSAIIGAATVAGVLSDGLGGPPITRACLEAVKHGAMGAYRVRIREQGPHHPRS